MLATLNVQPTGHAHRDDERNSKREEGQSKILLVFSSRTAACSKCSVCIQLPLYTSIRSLSFFPGIFFSCIKCIVHCFLHLHFYFLNRNCWFLQPRHKHDLRETDMVSSSRLLHHRIGPPYPTHGALGLWVAALTVPTAGDRGLNHHIQEIQLLPLKDSPPIPCSLSLLSCPSFIVLLLSPWWLLFVTWGKQTLAFLLSFHSRTEFSANPKQNINPAHHYIWGFRRDSGCLDAVLKNNESQKEENPYFSSLRLSLQKHVWAASYIMSVSFKTRILVCVQSSLSH